jgi:hypothetical protein
MMSVEGELVPFKTRIKPSEANGAVEKWLVQVRKITVWMLHHCHHFAIPSFAEGSAFKSASVLLPSFAERWMLGSMGRHPVYCELSATAGGGWHDSVSAGGVQAGHCRLCHHTARRMGFAVARAGGAGCIGYLLDPRGGSSNGSASSRQ